jgi:hypothetical protein
MLEVCQVVYNWPAALSYSQTKDRFGDITDIWDDEWSAAHDFPLSSTYHEPVGPYNHILSYDEFDGSWNDISNKQFLFIWKNLRGETMPSEQRELDPYDYGFLFEDIWGKGHEVITFYPIEVALEIEMLYDVGFAAPIA